MSPCVLMYVTDFAGHTTVMKEMDIIIGIAVIIIVIMTITFSYLFSVKFLSLGGLFVFGFLCLCLVSFCVCFVVVVWGCFFFMFSGFLSCHIPPPPHPNTPHNNPTLS